MHGKWQAFSALSSAVMLRFSWSVVMLHVLETFCFMTLSYNVKLSLFGPRWLFCSSCRKRLRYIVLLLSVSMSVRNKNLSHFTLQLFILGAWNFNILFVLASHTRYIFVLIGRQMTVVSVFGKQNCQIFFGNDSMTLFI